MNANDMQMSNAQSTWDETVDFLVIGSGAAGLAGALTASTRGLSVLVVEKESQYGGTTALSGGVMWIPNNAPMRAAGLEDSAQAALTYLQHNIGNRVGQAKLERFVDAAPKMLDLLCSRGFLEVAVFEGFPDYRPETPGSVQQGRSVEPKVFASRRLGQELAHLRRRGALAPGGLVGTMSELRRMAAIRSNPAIFLRALPALLRNLWNKVSGAGHLATGGALIAWLRHAMQSQNIPLWLNSPLRELLLEEGAVVGAIVAKQGTDVRVAVRRGVLVAAGGFEHNEVLRQQFFGADATTQYSSGSPGNTGDGVQAGVRAGAATDLMDDAWWAPTFMPPGGSPQIVIFERGKPGNIIVNAAGERFANEALPYNELVKQMQEADQSGVAALPSFMIFDDTYRSRYPLGSMLPGVTPEKYVENGFIIRCATVAELAGRMGIDPAGLQASVTRFNAMAARGVDEDFHRGESAFDKFSGDPAVTPNCCLAPLVKPPFYGMRLYPGDLGTKGGLLTNEHAQVVNDTGQPIVGLYAAGNSSASIMGNYYPGAGGTIGPAMTLGYLAAMHAADHA